MEIEVKTEKNNGRMHILVYGFEKLGYEVSEKKIERSNYILYFGDFKKAKEFQEYDGVIMMQGIWETDKGYRTPYPEEDELQKRTKQLIKLLKKSGFVCFLVQGITHDLYDLVKEVVSWFSSTYVSEISPQKFLKIYRHEFKEYLDSYGVARTKFSTYNEDISYKVICSLDRYDTDVGLIIDNQIYFVPCHAPDKSFEELKKLLSPLAGALVATAKKIWQEISDWADEYRFIGEDILINDVQKLMNKVRKKQAEIEAYRGYKGCLCFSGDPLKDAVAEVLGKGFGFNVSDNEEFKEDIRIINNEGDPIVFCEVKGKNKGVSREDVNQVDSHRERNGYNADFPGVLIVNTFIKHSNSVAEKDREVESDQIKHTVKMNIVILRTLDLLNALYQVDCGILKPGKFLELLKTKSGWVKFTLKDYEIVTE